MKKVIALLSVVGTIALFITQCSQPVGPVATESMQSVKVAVMVPKWIDTLMEKALVRVSAPDMQTIETPLIFTAGTLAGEVKNIPCGNNRLFNVIVYGFGGEVLYTGSEYATIDPLKNAIVTIVLKKPLGSATLQGYVEDVNVNETISSPTDPVIQGYDATDTGLAVDFQTSICTSSNGHDVIYSFDAGIVGEIPVSAHVFSEQPYASLTFTKDGKYYVLVTVSCKTHPEVVAQSVVEFFEVKGKKILNATSMIIVD